MSQPSRIAVLVGSLRSGSISRKIARALAARAPRGVECRFVEIGDLPLYNEDLDHSPPAAWARFRKEMREAEAVLFVTPEYNRSIPGCLKNALDVGSRPEKQSVFDGVPAAVVSVTPYKLGAFGANHALRQTFVFLNMPVMQQPEAYIGGAGALVGDDGEVKSEETSKLLATFMEAFSLWIARARRGGQDFEAFMKQRETIASDYANGDARSLLAIASEQDPATFFSPRGDVQRGAEAIRARYEKDAASFGKGSTSRLEVMQSAASGELAFWTGVQRADVRMANDGKKVPMAIRVTEIFRRENGELKLVHRHADFEKS